MTPPPHLTRWQQAQRGAACPERVVCSTLEGAFSVIALTAIVLAAITDAITVTHTLAAAIPLALTHGWTRGYEHHADRHRTIAPTHPDPGGYPPR